MRKLAVLFIILYFFAGCSKLPSGSVRAEIQPAYFASVAIVDKNGDASGAGTIILNKKGHQLVIITAAHVINGMKKRGNEDIYIIPSYSKTKILVKTHKINNKSDLALLLGYPKEKRDGPYVKLASRAPNIGDPIWAIGSPMGTKWTVSKGIISNFEVIKSQMYYRITADMFFGNSGGGLFNNNNELIGVVNSIQLIKAGFSILVVPGANFAVPLKSIKNFI